MFLIEQRIAIEDLKRILRFADFIGRSQSGYHFIVNLRKVNENGVTSEDLLRTVKEYKAIPYRKEEDVKYKYKYKLTYRDSSLLVSYPYYSQDIKSLLLSLRGKEIDPRIVSFPLERAREVMEKLIGLEEEEGGPENKEINVEFIGSLRDYQGEALDQWLKHGARGIISLPTGAGKTVVGVSAIGSIKRKTLIVAYTKEQVIQWKGKVEELLRGDFSVGLYYSEEKLLGDITITTYQTAYKHLSILPLYSFLIIDEVHHLPADKFKVIAMSSKAKYRLGLSATPYREDGLHKSLFDLMGGLVYTKDVTDLIKVGYVAPYEVKRVKVELTKNERAQYNSLISQMRKNLRGFTFRDIFHRARQGDRNALLVLQVYNELRKMVGLTQGKLEVLRRIVKGEESSNSKIIIFTQYVEHAERIGKEFNIPVLTGKTNRRERERILEEFRKNQSGTIVMTTVGDEGLDIPDANIGIIVSGTSSKRQFIQRLGRLLRPKDVKRAQLIELIAKGTVEEFQSRKRRSISLNDILRDSL